MRDDLAGHSPSRDWLPEWAKTAAITTAISRSLGDIRSCERTYKDQGCTDVAPGDHPDYTCGIDELLGSDPDALIAELDPLSRAVLVLRLAIGASIQDCALPLNVSRRAVLAVNCRVMTWLRGRQIMEAPANVPAHSD